MNDMQVSASNGGYDFDLEDVAKFLLHKNYVLTALEFYTELKESNKDLPLLEHYFSNPSNFEHVCSKDELNTSGSLYRSGSVSTFDSLDIARYSDDDTQTVDDKIAVLEFKLRKAEDTIKSLRRTITRNATTDEPTENNDLATSNKLTEFQPMEKRAINFLIGEYLVDNNFMLTSITFADENEDQDFESWDDVGLNTPKPPNLMKIYHDHGRQKANDACNKCASLQEEYSSFKSEIEDMLEASKLENEQLSLQNKELFGELEEQQNTITSLKVELKAMGEFKMLSEESENDLFVSCENIVETFESRCHTMFWNDLFVHPDHPIDESEIDASKIADNHKELLNLLACHLPSVLPAVMLAKRELLVPMILSVAVVHADTDTRKSLLRIFFNLIKKPNAKQRQIMARGCASFAEKIGRHRAEEEILPFIWEHLNHKYEERRLLVSMLVGAIAPFISTQMTSSLFLSILQQMQQEENAEDVKMSICKSLAVVISLLHDENKYNIVFEMVKSYLDDTSANVRACARSSLLPAMAMWSCALNTIHSSLFKWLLGRCNGKEQTSDEQIEHCEDIKVGVLHLFVAILQTMPIVNMIKQLDHNLITQTTERLPGSAYVNCDGAMLMGGNETLAKAMLAFDESLNSKTYINNGLVMWTLEEFLPTLYNILCNTSAKLSIVIRSFAQLFESICLNFGKVFTELLYDQFTEIFCKYDKLSMDKIMQITSAAFPVYITGVVVVKYDKSQTMTCLNMLKEAIILLSTSHASLDSVDITFQHLRSRNVTNDLLDILLSTSNNSSHVVRSASAQLYRTVLSSDTTIDSMLAKIMPVLTELANDRNQDVRNATISPLGCIMESPHVSIGTVSAVVTLMQQMVAANNGNHLSNMALVQMLSRVAPKSHPKFQQEFVLPVLAEIASSNNLSTNTTKRSDLSIELLKAYTNLSCCFFSPDLLFSMFLPGLGYLEKDLEECHPECMDALIALKNEITAKSC